LKVEAKMDSAMSIGQEAMKAIRETVGDDEEKMEAMIKNSQEQMRAEIEANKKK
jgi:hypothetical protein